VSAAGLYGAQVTGPPEMILPAKRNGTEYNGCLTNPAAVSVVSIRYTLLL
jgi:hypothetical protein